MNDTRTQLNYQRHILPSVGSACHHKNREAQALAAEITNFVNGGGKIEVLPTVWPTPDRVKVPFQFGTWSADK